MLTFKKDYDILMEICHQILPPDFLRLLIQAKSSFTFIWYFDTSSYKFGSDDIIEAYLEVWFGVRRKVLKNTKIQMLRTSL